MEQMRSDLGVPGLRQPTRSVLRRGAASTIANQPMISRRAVIGGGLAGLGGLVLFPSQLLARAAVPNDSFVVLLKALYQPVVHGPNLGLSTVDLNDGSYSTTRASPSAEHQATRTRTSRSAPSTCSSKAISARTTSGRLVRDALHRKRSQIVDDGAGGQFLDGTFDLTIVEATGVYRPFVGGHNRMVDKLHFLASGDVDEFCFCFISIRERR